MAGLNQRTAAQAHDFATKLKLAKERAHEAAQVQIKAFKAEETQLSPLSISVVERATPDDFAPLAGHEAPQTTSSPLKGKTVQGDYGTLKKGHSNAGAESDMLVSLSSVNKKRKRTSKGGQTPVVKVPDEARVSKRDDLGKRPFAPPRKPTKAQRPVYESV